MFQKFRHVLLLAFVAAMSIGASQFDSSTFAASGPGSGGGGVREPRLEGTLVAVNAPMVSVRTRNGTVRIIAIPPTAKIERNDVRATLAAFKIGDRVQARFTLNGATVTKFEGVGP
ncbi:MAG: hypothetical protein ABL921_22425 [Pirellula sp.]